MNVRALFAVPLSLLAFFLLALPVEAQTAQQICVDQKASDDDTIASCTQAIASSQATGHNLAVLYYDRGIGYNGKGQFDLAIADYNQALSLDPNYGAGYNNRGHAYYGKGQDDLALADFIRALQIEPTNAIALSNRALVYSRRKQYDLAIADFSQALRIDPSRWSDFQQRCVAYARQGQYDLARIDCNRAISMNPNGTATAQSELQQMTLSTQKDVLARTRAIKAALTAPSPPSPSAEFYQEVGAAKYALAHATKPSDYEDAIAAFQKASLLAPWVPDVYLDLATAQEAIQNFDDAKTSLQLYLLASPKSKDAILIQQRIGALDYQTAKKAAAAEQTRVAAAQAAATYAADAPRRTIAALFSGVSWHGSDCHVGKEDWHGQKIAGGGCNTKEVAGPNWWIFTAQGAPQILSFEVRSDGTVKAPTMSVWAGCSGDVVGIPRDQALSEIRWVVWPAGGVPQDIYAYLTPEGTALTVSCTRPLTGAAPGTKYRYVQFNKL